MDTKCDGCDGLKQKSGEKKFIKTLFKGVTPVTSYFSTLNVLEYWQYNFSLGRRHCPTYIQSGCVKLLNRALQTSS